MNVGHTTNNNHNGVHNGGGVKVYTVNGAAAGTGSASSLPDWLTRRRAAAKHGGNKKRVVKEELQGSVNLIQHFEFPEASNRIKVTRDGKYAVATGVYKPQMRVYDLYQLTLKFERHSDAENVDFQILSDDWTKTIHLQTDRTIELHNQGGLFYRTRIPRFGRAIAYHFPSCDALVGGAGDEIYRLNLEQGRFMTPLVLGRHASSSALGAVEGVNAIDINPAHNLFAFATDGPGSVEFWDPRSRSPVGVLRLPRSLISPSTAARSTFLPGVDDENSTGGLSATALASRMDGLSLAVGTSTGHTLLYDIRSPKPYATKDQGYGLPIKRVQWIEGPASRMAGDHFICTADKKVLKVWDKDTPVNSNFASITTPTDVNDFVHVSGSGLFMCANEGMEMTSYYVPQLGPAPKWCSFLDNLTEEMEDQTVRNTYEDFKFVDKTELSTLGLDHLVGTPALKPYMHGYFMSLKLYDAARVIANPFIYAEHREKVIRQKLEKLAEERIRTRKNHNLPKVNRALAERIMKSIEKEKSRKRKRDEEGDVEMEDEEEKESGSDDEEEQRGASRKKDKGDKLLMDPRFKSMFEDPAFEIDETSKEFALLHPSQAEAAARKRKQEGLKAKTKTAVDEEDEEKSSGGGISSDDLGMDETESGDEEEEPGTNSSEEEMEMVSLRPGQSSTKFPSRPQRPMPKMVSAQATTANERSTGANSSASFGQRRHTLPSSSSKSAELEDTSGDIIRRGDEGGMVISFVPDPNKAKEEKEARRKEKQKGQPPKKRPGIEYLGAGLEKGVERTEVSEKDKKGRTHRRKGMRSGSKNTFRRL